MRLHHLLPGLCAATLIADLGAQQLRGDITVAVRRDAAHAIAGGFYEVDRNTNALVPWSNQPAVLTDMSTVCASPWKMSRYFACTDGALNVTQPGYVDVWMVEGAAVATAGSARVTRTARNEGYVSAMTVIGDYVYCMGQRTIFRVHIATGATETVYTYATGESPFGMTTDGRWLHAALTARDIKRISIPHPNDVRPVAHVPGQFLDILTALALRPNGLLLAATGDPFLGANLHEIDVATGTVLRSLPLPMQMPCGLVVDPLTNEVLVYGTLANSSGVIVPVNNWTVGTVLANPAGYGGLAVRRSWPIHRFGQPCAQGGGAEPKITATAVPLRGTTWTVQLQTLANHGAILTFAPHPVPGSVPWQLLDSLGAPGCVVTAPSVGTVVSVTDAAGGATYSLNLPNNVAFRDAAVDFQWLIVDPTANALGAAVTNTGSAIVD